MAKNPEILRLSLTVADPHDAFIMYASKEPRLSFHDCLEWFNDGCILGKTLNHLTLKTCFMRISNGSTSISERSLDVLLTSISPLYGFDHTSLDNAQCKAEILSRLYDKRPLRSLKKPLKSVSESYKVASPQHRGGVPERRFKLFDAIPALARSTSPPHSASPLPDGGGAIRGGEPPLTAKKTGSGPHTIFGGGLKRINAGDEKSINASANHSSNQSVCFPADLAEWERTLHATDSNDDNNNMDNIMLYGTRNVHVNRSDLMSSMNLEDDDYFVDSMYLEGVDSTISVQHEGRMFGSEVSYDVASSSCCGHMSDQIYSIEDYLSDGNGSTLGDKSHAATVCSMCGSTLSNNCEVIFPSCTCSEASFDVDSILTKEAEEETMNDINNDDIMGKVDAILAKNEWKDLIFGKHANEEEELGREGVAENDLRNFERGAQRGDLYHRYKGIVGDAPVAMEEKVGGKGKSDEVATNLGEKCVASVDVGVRQKV